MCVQETHIALAITEFNLSEQVCARARARQQKRLARLARIQMCQV